MMTGTTVVNKRTHTPTSNDVYIGRGSTWDNPFRINKETTRFSTIAQYRHLIEWRLSEEYLYDETQLKNDILALEGKTLVCYCKPRACHGDVLVKLIEELKEEL